MKQISKVSTSVFILIMVTTATAGQIPRGERYTPLGDAFWRNSIGMKFIRVEPGTFRMGQLKRLPPEVLPLLEGGDRGGRFDLLADGDFDEKPVHTVKITKPFYMGSFEVTNKQYELFDPGHKLYRGKNGFSRGDNEAAIYVSWYDAQAFCQWLSDKEGLPDTGPRYRLPTEAEWEYACRAGTKTNYYTGDILPKEFCNMTGKNLDVGQTPPNPWGLYDMHGNVEEWCLDWYGPYVPIAQTDPIGYVDGDFRVTRGGSHSTYAYYLRSANRMATIPSERQWVTGFRVVLGEMPKSKPLPLPPKPLCQQNVIQRSPAETTKGPDPDKPYFKGPRVFVKIPRDAIGPLFAGHNHSPAIVACPNGDLLATWFSCVTEGGREMTRGGSRLRWGQEEWEPASLFWDNPDRNDSVTTLWNDGNGTIYHFVGVDVSDTYSHHALGLRTSRDNGATWSKVRIFNPEHVVPKGTWGGNCLDPGGFRMRDGAIALVTDGLPTLWISHNEALTFQSCGGRIVGNHPGVTQLNDGRLVGFVRGDEVPAPAVVTTYTDMGKTLVHKTRAHRMAQCYSSDNGKTWVRTRSIFPGIGGGQRLALLRLKEGPIFFASFADRGIIITDSSGAKREVRGLFAAVSEDKCKTWSNVRLVSDDGPGRPAMTTNGGFFCMSERNAEYRGYLAACQGTNGVIHLISSFSHYSFNLKWLKTPPPPLRYPPMHVRHVKETFTGPDFDAPNWHPYHGDEYDI